MAMAELDRRKDRGQMSTRRENEALVTRLCDLIEDIAKHQKRLEDADDHDAAEAWDDVVRDLRRAEGNAPSTEDRP